MILCGIGKQCRQLVITKLLELRIPNFNPKELEVVTFQPDLAKFIV